MTTPCSTSVQSPQHITRTRARQQALVDEAVTALQQRFPGKTVDVGGADGIVPAIRPTRATDRAHDGEILGADGLWSLLAQESQVAPVLPNNGARVTSTVILVNGIMTDAALHLADMQGLANTGCAVLGVRNATQGLARDLLECVHNKLDRGDTRDTRHPCLPPSSSGRSMATRARAGSPQCSQARPGASRCASKTSPTQPACARRSRHGSHGCDGQSWRRPCDRSCAWNFQWTSMKAAGDGNFKHGLRCRTRP
jgi:hypothetical protein